MLGVARRSIGFGPFALNAGVFCMARQTQRSQVTSLMTKTHKAVDHQAADHQAVDHQEADQQVDDLQNAAKSSTIEGRTIWTGVPVKLSLAFSVPGLHCLSGLWGRAFQ